MIKFEEITSKCSGVERIARGGQKIVYKADHPEHGDVVIKVFIENGDERLMREIDISTDLLKSDYIPAIYEHGELIFNEDTSYYIIEERINGILLRDLIGLRRFSLEDAVKFLEQGLNFIQHMESCKIVHRDIKPENIIFCDTGKYYFLDLGIARALELDSLTKTEALGPHTPGYAAPEQFNNLKDDIDSRADIFSLGVVTYECLFGENPFRKANAESPFQILLNTMTVNPIERIIDGDNQKLFIGLLSTMMQKSLSARPRDAEQAMSWLESAKSTLV